jgi:hypothetical protein
MVTGKRRTWKTEGQQGPQLLRGLAVNGCRIDETRANRFRSLSRHASKEATPIAFVARRAGLPHLEQNCVGIAIDVHTFNVLHVAAFFTFPPQPAAGTAEVNGPSGGQRFREAFGVHPGQHEYFASFGILRDGGKQSVAFGEIGDRLSWFGHRGDWQEE